MEFFRTIASNWFELLQTFGIVASVLFSTVTLREERRARRAENAFEMISQHRELWLKVVTQSDFQRILRQAVDLTEEPITHAEDFAVASAISHFNTCINAAREKVLILPEQIRADIRYFFSLPIPRAVFERRKPFLNRDLVSRIEAELDC